MGAALVVIAMPASATTQDAETAGVRQPVREALQRLADGRAVATRFCLEWNEIEPAALEREAMVRCPDDIR